jgi:hypothetical protein
MKARVPATEIDLGDVDRLIAELETEFKVLDKLTVVASDIEPETDTEIGGSGHPDSGRSGCGGCTNCCSMSGPGCSRGC